MAVLSGFFNSVEHDRKYNATHFAKIFDGIINDGIFATIGTSLVVKASSGTTVNVGIGKAWFNHTWTINDSVLPIKLPVSDPLLNRIDAVILDINNEDSVRANNILYVTGSPASSPSRPSMISTDSHHQYALCYIYRAAGSSSIGQSNITNMVGTSSTPFVTGILKTLNSSELTAQWEAQFDIMFNNLQREIDSVVGGTNFDPKPIQKHNINVAASSFKSLSSPNAEETKLKNLGYEYYCDVAVTGVVSTMIPYLTFSLSDMTNSGIAIANQFSCYNGGVRLYSDGVPETNITILTVECRKAVT